MYFVSQLQVWVLYNIFFLSFSAANWESFQLVKQGHIQMLANLHAHHAQLEIIVLMKTLL